MSYGDARGGFKGNQKSHLDGWPLICCDSLCSRRSAKDFPVLDGAGSRSRTRDLLITSHTTKKSQKINTLRRVEIFVECLQGQPENRFHHQHHTASSSSY